MKKIFKGTVNGVVYDTVENYNKAVNEALAKGENISASTSTEIVEEDDNQITPERFFPFNEGKDVEEFVADYENAEGEVIDDHIEKVLSDVESEVEEYIENGGNKEELRDTIAKYLNNADKYATTISKKIEEIRRKIDELDDELWHYELVEGVVDTAICRYADIFEKLDEKKCCGECKNECHCECKQKEQATTEFDVVEEIMKIINKMK